MPPLDLSVDDQWTDHFQALDFAERQFTEWMSTNVIRNKLQKSFSDHYAQRRAAWSAAQKEGQDVPKDIGLPKGRTAESSASRLLRYWIFVEREIRSFADQGWLPLAQAHNLLAEARERQAVLERQLTSAELPEVIPLAETAIQSSQPPSTQGPRRNFLEILLEPRNIQVLLALGGALMVVGLVILLWVNEFFTPPVVAISLGVGNAALLGVGWWVLRSTRYLLAGRALTLLACLVMPLNLWYYHANNLITLDGHLWVPALVISVLYAASAVMLRDELFVYIFVAGVTLTGLLILADIPPSPQKFWEIASPATLLVVLGLLAILVERAFPEQEGPFSRRGFGLAFFWSGHVLLASGLLLVLGAQIAGDWLYEPVFKVVYQLLDAKPSPIVGELRWLALALVITGTFAYIYSDIVVRHVGVYVHIAAATLLWTLLLSVQLLNVAVGIDTLIALLAVTALILNGSQATIFRDSLYTRSLPILGILMPLLAVALGLLVYIRALSLDLRNVWYVAPPAWSYVGAMLLTALSCRAGAHWYRHTHPKLTMVYFFATAAATMVAATALLAALGLNTWEKIAPWLMLFPLAYLIAARLYRGHSMERPLFWVSHVATAVMLFSSLVSAVEGFTLVEQQSLNLVLALFFAEAAVFYTLATLFYRHVSTIHLGAAMACGAVWQLLTYQGVATETYTLTFALVGLGLLVIYRFAVVERLASGPLADAVFQSANTLMSLALLAALFLGMSQLATAHALRWQMIGLFAVLSVASLVAVMLVRHPAWRRWYVVTAIGQAALTYLGITIISKLTPLQKLEIFSVTVGLLLLVVGHIGWYREHERESDLVSLSLLLGSLLVGVPLAVATLIDRSRDHFIVLNELGFLAAGVLLLTTGILFQLKATTLTGALLTAVYFLTLLIYVPWSRLNAVAIFIIVGGGILFGMGLLLSVYRDRLLALPDQIKRRQGVFRVLSWR
ncbi:MAG: hypothetical protein ACK4RK_16990 [Gemmataceae bacterium]